jgi:hypothetical protein
MYYKDIRKQLKVPYVIYADFESLLVPIEGCENDPEKSQTAKTTKHMWIRIQICRFNERDIEAANSISRTRYC